MQHNNYLTNLILSMGITPAETQSEYEDQIACLKYILDARPLAENAMLVLKARYEKEFSITKTGKILGLQADKVRQVESKALRGLRCHYNRYVGAYERRGYRTRREACIAELTEEIRKLEKLRDDLQTDIIERN